jgi:hypothetical protein
MQTGCTVQVVGTLSDTHRLTQHDLLAFSSSKTQVEAYCIPQTRFTIRLMEHPWVRVLPRLCCCPVSLRAGNACPLGTNALLDCPMYSGLEWVELFSVDYLSVATRLQAGRLAFASQASPIQTRYAGAL